MPLFRRALSFGATGKNSSPWRCAFSVRCDPTRGRQRGSRPRDKLIRLVEQPLGRAPKGEVYGAALLLVAEGRRGLGFLEGRPVVVINPEVERVVRHHPQHQSVTEHAGLAEHAPHCHLAERGKLLTQELGKTVAGNHPPNLVPDLSPSSSLRSGQVDPSWIAASAW